GGEKLSFKVTVLLAISVLLLILHDILPSTDQKTPLRWSLFRGFQTDAVNKASPLRQIHKRLLHSCYTHTHIHTHTHICAHHTPSSVTSHLAYRCRLGCVNRTISEAH